MRSTTSAGRRLAATSLTLLTSFGQFLLDNQEQGIIFQRLIDVAHPGFAKILHRLGDKAVGKISLQTPRSDHEARS